MSAMSLEEQLKAALEGINHQYELARNQLFKHVEELSAAAQSATNGAITLKLDTQNDDGEGRTFLLSVIERTDATVTKNGIMSYFVPLAGYPIHAGSAANVAKQPTVVISDSEQLARHFSDLASNKSSPVVVRLAYFLRSKSG